MTNANMRLFLSLYALQGLIVAYLFNFNKNYMIASGISAVDASTVETIALLPLALKFLAGPFSDRFSPFGLGHRLPYIWLGLLAQSAGLAGLAAIDPGANLGLFAAMALLAVLGLSINDTCCDGMVIDVTPDSQRASVQGRLWTSRFLAATLGTLTFGMWLKTPLHADRALWVCAAFGVVPLALTLGARESAKLNDADRFRWSALEVMLKPRSLAVLAFGTLYGIVGMGVETNLSVYYTKIGLDPTYDVGQLGALRNFGRAAGALMLPFAWLKLSRRHVMILGIALLAVSILGQGLVEGRASAGVWTFLFGIANGWCDAMFATLAMESSSPILAASTFALFMAVTNLSVIGDALFAFSVSQINDFWTFVATSVLACFALIPAWWLGKAPLPPLRDDADVA